jgi:hypothetical protein
MNTDIFKTHDVFISYVVEDRQIVEDLVSQLRDKGLKVWYAKDELRAGTDIRKLIDTGLANSKYGISIISPEYNSHWTVGELFVLIRNTSRFLPVLHNVSLEEACLKHPGLINFYCLDTQAGTEHVAREILKTIRPRPAFFYALADFFCLVEKNAFRLLGLSGLVLLIIVSSSYYRSVYPPESFIESTIRERISDRQNMAQSQLQQNLIQNNATLSDMQHVEELRKSLESAYKIVYHNNEVDFSDGEDHIKSVAGLVNEEVFESRSQVEPPFGLKDYRVYLCNPKKGLSGKQLLYNIYNMEPIGYKELGAEVKKGVYEVEVEYTNGLRYAEVDIRVDVAGERELSQIHLMGFKKRETIVFERKGNNWAFLRVY